MLAARLVINRGGNLGIGFEERAIHCCCLYSHDEFRS